MVGFSQGRSGARGGFGGRGGRQSRGAWAAPSEIQGMASIFIDYIDCGMNEQPFYTEIGTSVREVENRLVCRSTKTVIPYFNAPVYVESKVRIEY